MILRSLRSMAASVNSTLAKVLLLCAGARGEACGTVDGGSCTWFAASMGDAAGMAGAGALRVADGTVVGACSVGALSTGTVGTWFVTGVGGALGKACSTVGTGS